MSDNRKQIDLSKYCNALSRKHQMVRLVWGVVWPLGTWFLPRSMGMPWKRILLRAFRAKIADTANVYSSVCFITALCCLKQSA